MAWPVRSVSISTCKAAPLSRMASSVFWYGMLLKSVPSPVMTSTARRGLSRRLRPRSVWTSVSWKTMPLPGCAKIFSMPFFVSATPDW